MVFSNCAFGSVQQVSKYPLTLIGHGDWSGPWRFGPIWVQPGLCGLKGTTAQRSSNRQLAACPAAWEH